MPVVRDSLRAAMFCIIGSSKHERFVETILDHIHDDRGASDVVCAPIDDYRDDSISARLPTFEILAAATDDFRDDLQELNLEET